MSNLPSRSLSVLVVPHALMASEPLRASWCRRRHRTMNPTRLQNKRLYAAVRGLKIEVYYLSYLEASTMVQQ